MVKARAASGKQARALTTGRAAREAGTGAKLSAAPPAIILVNPQLGENIGFAARAMANFGLTDLRLVAPRDGWPNDKAHAAAAGAAFVVERASVYPSVESAVAELHFVLASTARPREMIKPVLSPESAAVELRRRGENEQRGGVLFGPERSGLDNDTISLADAILTAPVSPDFASLSLPQAVLLFGYEWLKAQSAALPLGRATAFDGPVAEGIAFPDTRPATREELIGLFNHLEAELDRTGFLYPPEKRPSMVRAIRNMFHRMGATEQDVRTWRGIVASLSRKHASRGNKVS
jgi:tRNA/rRNA methyltransferase